MEEIHAYARTLPRHPQWHRIAKAIDELVIAVADTDRDIDEILEEADAKIKK
jgi:maltose-binding protein MalE